MKPGQSVEERLWDFIDGTTPAGEISAIEKLLEVDEDWKHVYRKLMDMHQMLQSSELEQPSLRFTKNVMDQIAVYNMMPAAKKYINKKIIWAIGSFFIVLIGGLLIYGFTQVDWSSTAKSKFPFDAAKIDLSMFFNNTYMHIFMMLNVVLGLMLVDRFLRSKTMSYTVRKKS